MPLKETQSADAQTHTTTSCCIKGAEVIHMGGRKAHEEYSWLEGGSDTERH